MRARGVLAVGLVLALSAALALPAADGDSGVGVWNAPPNFLNIEVGESEGYVTVTMNVSDANGHLDVYSVNLLVVDDDGAAVSNVTYFQHDTQADYEVVNDRFVDNEGGFLISDRCVASRYFNVQDWFLENNTLRVVFYLEQFSGKTLKVTGMDIQNATCFYEGPFSSSYRPPPAVHEKEVIYLVAVSVVLAAIGAVVIAYRRGLSNRMARQIERRESAREEAEEE